jgi:small GTP-binding protein
MKPQQGETSIVKVVTCGNAGVGKSAIMRRLCENHFKPTEDPTIGATFNVRTMVTRATARRVKMQLWDMSGHERFRNMVSGYFVACNALIYVFDVGNRESFDAIDKVWRPASGWANASENPRNPYASAYLMGNKTDLPPHRREVAHDEAAQYAKNNAMRYVEVSARDGCGIAEFFLDMVDFLDSLSTSWKRVANVDIVVGVEPPDDGCDVPDELTKDGEDGAVVSYSRRSQPSLSRFRKLWERCCCWCCIRRYDSL